MWKRLKQLVNAAIVTMLIATFIFLAQNIVEEIKPIEDPSYADTKGCSPDVWEKYNDCA